MDKPLDAEIKKLHTTGRDRFFVRFNDAWDYLQAHSKALVADGSWVSIEDTPLGLMIARPDGTVLQDNGTFSEVQ